MAGVPQIADPVLKVQTTSGVGTVVETGVAVTNAVAVAVGNGDVVAVSEVNGVIEEVGNGCAMGGFVTAIDC